MKIGIISDTHLPEMAPMPVELAQAFAGVDLILHAGDIKHPMALDFLERIAPVLAVEISPSYCDDDPRVMYERVMEYEGHTIGMRHDFQFDGHGWEVMPGSIGRRFPAEVDVTPLVTGIFGKPCDIVVFGHTHYPMVEWHSDTLFINPGSATLPRQIRKLGTVAILELTPTSRDAQIVELSTYRQ